MITLEEALNIILSNVKTNVVENIPIKNCVNRVLSDDIFSDINMPPFDKSAVDGYACKKTGLHKALQIIEVVAAGKLPSKKVTYRTCVKVMTGAKIPEGAELVIMVEDVEVIDKQTIRFIGSKTSENICYKSEDIKEGSRVLSKGTLLKPYHAGILTTVGIASVLVYEKVKVGIIITGDEIIEPQNTLPDGKIFNSNAYQLLNSCLALNVIPDYYGIVEDNYEIICNAINIMLKKTDVVLITGGVSVGDFDYVPASMKNVGLKIKFDSIAMQPGRPLTYATKGNKHCFGLPGNPVSTFVQFELSIKPLLYKIMGHDYKPLIISLKLSETITRKEAKRKSFYPVRLNSDNTIAPVSYHGSAHINSYAEAFGIISMDIGVFEINKGTEVYVRQI